MKKNKTSPSTSQADAQLRAAAKRLLQKQNIILLLVVLSMALAGRHFYQRSLAAPAQPAPQIQPQTGDYNQ
jgi:hypothetical protein